MISARRILHWRRMYAVNSLPFSVTITNWRMISVCNYHVGDENTVRQLGFRSIRYFGTLMNHINKTELSESEIKRIKNSARIGQERATIGLMLNNIDCLTSYHFIDEKSKREKNLDGCMWKSEASCRKYWLAVFKGPKTPLAVELEEKLKNKGISNEDFVRSFITIYFTMRSEPNFILSLYQIEPEDVLNAMNRLEFNDTQRDCLRILYSLHEEFGWKI